MPTTTRTSDPRGNPTMPRITDATREKPIPEHVRGLAWHIDETNRLAFNRYGSIDCYKTTSYGVQGRITIENARRYAAALTALLAAYDQTPIELAVAVVVENSSLTNAIRSAEQALTRAEEATRTLREVLEQAKSQTATFPKESP
jgi:hypothetical protein